ncbi:MAG TPA: phosphate acyltransferase PlsX [Solirubrobacteraceae bacterium]|jgi:glycerol-3-phosphate acyltransferase PlsX|nr:phosphate acyltransferase PlsX [Solirubrobacteraceae bacterium]
MQAARSSPPKRTNTTTITSSAGQQAPVVAVDANGADLGPVEVAAGAALAAAHGVRVLLFGPAAEIGETPDGVEVIDAPVSVAKSPDPVRAVRSTPEASIVQAARAIGEGRAQALVCAGGTGAALAAGLFNVKRAPGIHRPALALPIPVPGRPVTLLDVGANDQARPEHLVQFAYMGAAFATAVLGIREPRIGLLSNGEERSRGSELVLAAGAELDRRTRARDGARGLRFVGHVEGDGLVAGVADVVVTDGFTGNIALKLMEGVSQTVLANVRAAAVSSTRGKLGGLLLRPALRGFRDEIDPEGQGGAYLLGLRRLAVVPHGRFSRHGFAQAIARAELGARKDVVGATHAALRDAGVLRRAGGGAPTSGNATSLPGQ